MENYEQKYKDALERARIWKEKSGMPIDKQGILDDIFPELKKNEGEESKKWILEYLHDGLRKSDEQFKDHFRTAIAWLEKQKAQWTDEDERSLKQVTAFIRREINEPTSKSTEDWLKSLKERLQ